MKSIGLSGRLRKRGESKRGIKMILRGFGWRYLVDGVLSSDMATAWSLGRKGLEMKLKRKE